MKGPRICGLSLVTVGFGVYIVVSASFMLQVNVWLTSKAGDPFLARCFWTAAILAMAASVAYASGMRLRALRICSVIIIFAMAYLLGIWQTYFEEKTHILTYGLLGYLAAMDLSGPSMEKYGKARTAAAAIVFVALISAGDEIFQLILPYRFGEMKDFITNVLGGALGVVLFLTLNRRADKFSI